MVQLQAASEQFAEAKLQIVGLSYDSVEVLKKFSDKNAIKFPLLSDKGSVVIRKLKLEFRKGLPHPGTIIIGSDGVVRAKIFKKGYVKRHSNQELLDLAAKISEG